MYQCKNNGSCLKQTHKFNQYIKNDKYICVYNCQPLKCPNYNLCQNSYPKWIEDNHDGTCVNCDLDFGKWQGGKGKLNFFENIECPICLEYKPGVSYPKCDHYACIQCVRRCFYGDFSNEPKFPYPELENEYFENQEDRRWNEFPLIFEWKESWKNWDIETKNRRDNDPKTIKKCSLCRL